jgi:GDP/UDP-N,N'-diacetylbacillosamine 2-epimerase (hydrolysing)
LNKRKICVVTGTRAEYGLLRWLMRGIKDDPALTLQVIATGMHLSPEFGLSWRAIVDDGFVIDRKVDMLLSGDSPAAIAKSTGLGMIGLADALAQLQPDLMLVLGDRFEIFAAAAAALVARIPIAHLHGGEATEGAIDEALRHSITKMSHLHFVAHEQYRQRVIQLGEHPSRVWHVGGLGVDAIKRTKLLTRAALESELDFSLGEKSLLVTFHPATLETSTAGEQMQALLDALASRGDTRLIFTLPNADTDGRVLASMVHAFAQDHANARVFASLGQLRYLSCVAQVDGVVGNSSSGLAEVPSFRKGTVNIGDRQRGRLKAASVIDCAPTREAIDRALDQLYAPAFRAVLESTANPYGDGGASERILETIKRIPLHDLLKKSFYNLPLPQESK